MDLLVVCTMVQILTKVNLRSNYNIGIRFFFYICLGPNGKFPEVRLIFCD